MITRISKIARLPKPIRDELNHRLEGGQIGRTILPWLNALPETKTIMAEFFGGNSVTHQNLSEWRHGGYQDWLQHQHRLEWYDRFSEDETELAEHDRCGDTFDAMSRLFLAGIGQNLAAIENLKIPQERFLRMENLTREFTRLQNAYNYSRRVQLDFDKYNAQFEPEPLGAPCCPPGPSSRLTAPTTSVSLAPIGGEGRGAGAAQTHDPTPCESQDSRQRPGVRWPSGALPSAPQPPVVPSAENCTEPTTFVSLTPIGGEGRGEAAAQTHDPTPCESQDSRQRPEVLRPPGALGQGEGTFTAQEEPETPSCPPTEFPQNPSAFQAIPSLSSTIPTYKPASYYRIRRSRFAGIEG